MLTYALTILATTATTTASYDYDDDGDVWLSIERVEWNRSGASEGVFATGSQCYDSSEGYEEAASSA
jgi:hypothetical protein